MKILRDEFGEHRVVSRPEDVARSLSRPPRSPIQDPKLTSDALIDELELAVRSYIKVNYSLAVVQLANALTHADANYGLIVQDPKAKYAMSRAQVALALTHKKQAEQVSEKIAQLAQKVASAPRSGVSELLAKRKELEAKKKELEAGAREAMMAYIRSSREPVVRSMFGPPGEELYNDVRKTLDATKRGDLAISVNEADAQLFVNGVLVGHGATFASDQLPGPYCILVRAGQQMLRYDVTMQLGQRTALDIDWAFDSALRISDRWVGLMVPAGTAPATYVRRVSQRMGNQISLIFVGLRPERNHLVAYGQRYDRAYRDGYLRSSGEVHVTSLRGERQLGQPDQLKLRELVKYLVTGTPSPNILPIRVAEQLSASTDDSQRPQWPAYAALAGAVVAISLGAGSLVNEYGCNQDPSCKHSYPWTGVVGYTSMGVGIGLVAFAVYWFETEPAPAGGSAITLMPSRSGATIGWTKAF